MVGMGAASLLGLPGCTPSRSYPAPPLPLKHLSVKAYWVLEAVARRLVPAFGGQPGAGDLGVPTFLDYRLAALPKAQVADLNRALESIEDLTWLRLRVKPFTLMGPAEQDAHLRSWQGGTATQGQAFAALLRLVSFHHHVLPRAWVPLGYAGPWVGRVDVGLGKDNRGAMAQNPNPKAFLPFGPKPEVAPA